MCSSRWFRQRQHDPKVAVDDRTIPAAIMYVATTTGCAWQQLPPAFGASWRPMHRRFTERSTSRVWAKLYRVLLTKLGARGELDWSRCALGSVSARAMKGGALIRPDPADRGKKGSKIHLITERVGLPSLSRTVPPTSTTALHWNRWWAVSRPSVPAAGDDAAG